MKELFLAAILLGNFQVTSYRSVPVQTDSSPFITATGEHVSPHGVAFSRDQLARWGGRVQYGDLVYIEGIGFKVVNDCMNARHKYAVDIWVPTYEDERSIGVRRGKVWLMKTREQ